jgi:hypothetical protein
MTWPADGQTPRRDRLHSVLRGFGMSVALVLGALAVWLIVTTDTRKAVTVGALLGFWALLLAAFAVFGTRHPIPGLNGAGPETVVRPPGQIARVEDAAAQREYEDRLAEMLRREIHATLGAELTALRAEVAALRGELVEKADGQLRLERIGTTRFAPAPFAPAPPPPPPPPAPQPPTQGAAQPPAHRPADGDDDVLHRERVR